MNRHVSAERLSVYLDDELDPQESLELEDHVAQCLECQRRLSKLRGVVTRLRNLHRQTPPPVLGRLVLGRVAREGRPVGLIERAESRLRQLPDLEPAVMVGFAVVFALALVLYMFVYQVERRQHEAGPLVVAPKDVVTPQPKARQQRAGGRVFDYSDETWREQGIPDDGAVRRIETDSPEGQEILDQLPWIESLLEEGGRAVLTTEDGVVEIHRR